MKRLLVIAFSIILILVPTLTVFAGDIPESLLHSEDAEIFFGEVIAYHPDKENPDIVVSPVAMIKGDKSKEGTQQIYYNPNTIGDFKVRLDNIYLFTYFDEVNPTDIFDVTTFDTRTLKLKNVEGAMWERFEKYLNDGEYGEARIEGRENKSGLLPGVVGVTAVLILIGGVCVYKKRYRK